MLRRRFALGLLLVAVIAAGPLRRTAEIASPQRECAAEGRGTPPRHWLGCSQDPGSPRALAADERLVLGLPLDPNVSDARFLAFVPGLNRGLAAQIVADRGENGRYTSVDDLLRVRGIGPKRLSRARPHLAVEP